MSLLFLIQLYKGVGYSEVYCFHASTPTTTVKRDRWRDIFRAMFSSGGRKPCFIKRMSCCNSGSLVCSALNVSWGVLLVELVYASICASIHWAQRLTTHLRRVFWSRVWTGQFGKILIGLVNWNRVEWDRSGTD